MNIKSYCQWVRRVLSGIGKMDMHDTLELYCSLKWVCHEFSTYEIWIVYHSSFQYPIPNAYAHLPHHGEKCCTKERRIGWSSMPLYSMAWSQDPWSLSLWIEIDRTTESINRAEPEALVTNSRSLWVSSCSMIPKVSHIGNLAIVIFRNKRSQARVSTMYFSIDSV